MFGASFAPSEVSSPCVKSKNSESSSSTTRTRKNSQADPVQDGILSFLKQKTEDRERQRRQRPDDEAAHFGKMHLKSDTYFKNPQ